MNDAATLFRAIEDGDAGKARELVMAHPDLAAARNAAGVSALMMAAYHRHPEVVALLREALDTLDVFEAVAAGDAARFQQLLVEPRQTTDRSPDGFTALHFAAFFDRPDMARRLIDAGADVNATADNPTGVRPLHSALAARSVPIAQMLLEAGAEVDARQQGGFTALHAAALHDLTEAVELLVRHGADPRLATDDGRTAIGLAASDALRRGLEGTVR